MSSLKTSKLAFIGGGNMATAIISGLLSSSIPPSNITVSEPFEASRNKIASLGVNTTTSNTEATKDASIVVLAVKPQVAKSVCEELGAALSNTASASLPTVLSIAAGVTLASLKEWLTTKDGKQPHIVRTMPNTPALVGEGATGLFAGEEVAEEEKKLVGSLLKSVSRATEWVSSEEMLDVVTGLSGSGPAYFFQMVEHMIASVEALGMPRDQATRLAAQTCLGAGKMLVESSDSPEQLRKNVTSPNGTTHAALVSFEQLGFKDIVNKSVKAAVDRSVELGKPSS